LMKPSCENWPTAFDSTASFSPSPSGLKTNDLRSLQPGAALLSRVGSLTGRGAQEIVFAVVFALAESPAGAKSSIKSFAHTSESIS
jgi:hypothetical protein